MESIPCVILSFPDDASVRVQVRPSAGAKTVDRTFVPADARPGDWVTLYGHRNDARSTPELMSAPESTVSVLWLLAGATQILIGGGVFPDASSAHGYADRWGTDALTAGGRLQVEHLPLSSVGSRDRAQVT